MLVGCSHYPDVVAALLQLHDQVDEPRDGPFHSLAQGLVVLGQDPSDRAGAREERHTCSLCKHSMPIYGVLYPIQITCSIAFAQRTFPPSEFAPSEQERMRIVTEPPTVHDNTVTPLLLFSHAP